MATNTVVQTAPASSEVLVPVQISPVIEREFKRRDIFPELRLENATRIQNGATGVHKVSIAVANALLADAEAMQVNNRELPRGIPAAYSALMRNLKRTLKDEARRGLWDDPGMEEVQKRVVLSSACFDVGDSVLYFLDDEEEYGQEATIVDGYGMFNVKNDEGGHYVNDEGRRFDYRCGYAIKYKGSENRFFALPHQLTRDDCKPAHLCLVDTKSAGARHA